MKGEERMRKKPGRMLNRYKALTIAAGLVLAAGAVPSAIAKGGKTVSPSYSLLARGTSIDGYWDTDVEYWSWWGPAWWNGCSYCTDSASCQCFYSDSDGGSGIFQVNINQYTTMNWAMELDYTNTAGVPSGANWQSCYPASGEGWETDIGGSTSNFIDYSTTGQMCTTPWGSDLTYTGSWVVTDAGGLYDDYQGAGTMAQGIYGRLPSEVVSQVQYNGQINAAPPTPSELPTPSPAPSDTETATPTPTGTPTP